MKLQCLPLKTKTLNFHFSLKIQKFKNSKIQKFKNSKITNFGCKLPRPFRHITIRIRGTDEHRLELIHPYQHNRN